MDAKEGIMMWKRKGGCKKGVGVRILMCKLKAQMDKGEHSDVEMKGWMKKGAI